MSHQFLVILLVLPICSVPGFRLNLKRTAVEAPRLVRCGEAVEGAIEFVGKTWRRHTRCKCRVGFSVNGCGEKWDHGERYFSLEEAKGKHCRCMRNEINPSIGYLCRKGQGQKGQSYRVFAGEVAMCKVECNADRNCMGFDSTESGTKCRLYGANSPRMGDAGTENRQYCLKTDFDSKPVPGDGKFVPNLEWVASVLGVPVEELVCKNLKGGGNKGLSGASYFACDATYGIGSAAHPTLGLPTKLFLKVRNPSQDPYAFETDNAVFELAKNLPSRLPMTRALSYDRNYILMENMGTTVDERYRFTKAELKAVLDSFADFHGTFWGLAEAPGLVDQGYWSWIFTGQTVSLEMQLELLDWLPVPEPSRHLFKRALNEIGIAQILAHMNNFGMTLLHGDAHNGQIVRLDDGSSARVGGRTWGLIDFGWSTLGSPAIDIGAIMVNLGGPMDDAEFVNNVQYYYKQLLGHTGCSEPGTPNPFGLPTCSMDEFIKECRIAAALHGLWIIVGSPNFQNLFPNNARDDKDFFLNHPDIFDLVSLRTHEFQFFDQGTFDYLMEKTTKATCNLSLVTQLSGSACTHGTSFGCHAANSLFVDQGCRGTFVCNGNSVTCASSGFGRTECPCEAVPN